MKFLLITLSLVMSFQLHARHRVGNGGDVVVCQNGSVQTVELLDSYESREIYGNELKSPTTSSTSKKLLRPPVTLSAGRRPLVTGP
jgi:hypothetical protein